MTEFKEPVRYEVEDEVNFITYEKFDQVMTEAVKKYYNIR